MRKRGSIVEEHPCFEDGLLDKDYEKLLKLLQLGDKNLDKFSVDQARSLHNVDPRCKILKKSRFHHEDELLDVRNMEETLRKSKVTEKAKMLEEVKSEPLEFDCRGMNVNECFNRRMWLGESSTAIPVKNVVVSMDSVKDEAPDSDSGGNHEISERGSKRPRLNVRDAPQMMKSSQVNKKNKEIEGTSKKKEKMKRSMHTKSSLLPKSKKGMKNEIHAKVAHSIPSNSNKIFSRRKGPKVLHSSRYRCDPEDLSVTVDETYEAFLNNVMVSDGQLIYTTRNGRRKILGENLQSPSDSENTILDSDRRDGYCPSYVSTGPAINKAVGKNFMKRKMEYPKNYRGSSSDANPNQQNCRQPVKRCASDLKTKAATNRTLGRSVMKKKISCSKKYQDTLFGLDQNEQDSHKPDKSRTTSDVNKSFELFKTCIQAKTNTMHMDHLSSIPEMDTDAWHSDKSGNKFRKGLMKDLKRPYNQEEHLKLLEDACKQGPSDHEMDVCDDMESCQTPKKYGRTYLEVYKDLAEKISEHDGDFSKKLNLLRGLFYWLENKSEQGSFIPWRDKKYLKALWILSDMHVAPATTIGST